MWRCLVTLPREKNFTDSLAERTESIFRVEWETNYYQQ
jgi:hypothetical protein